ncbi:META domain-containing protein [Nitratireductor kimnyeongensis]|uniref:META domain-containing protein n=1 Tax=Nitratireductor kimnyeongensis TaxID=430679 RepID=A0ABW0T8J5_9HYPH|nr:META domain-containing protein [Nitratireductor kimnyeongensis]QZZ35829.1 META domain-containing protein [Nitratireductor kimnyeongensis]
MFIRRRILLNAIALLASAVIGTNALAQQKEKTMLTISGELAYLVRMALPKDSVAIVVLRNAMASDDEPPLAETRIALNGKQVPIAFSLSVEKQKLPPEKAYNFYAAIHDGEKQRWSSEAVLIDPEQGEIDLGTLFLVPAGTASRLTRATMDAIIDTEWVVEDIDGRGIIDSSRVSLTFAGNGSVSGRASCNSYSANWTEENGKLTLGPAATTKMACAEALMDQEQKFLSILTDLKLYATTPEGALVLQTIDGRKLRAFPAG